MKSLFRVLFTDINFYFILMSQPTDSGSEFHIRQMTFGSQLCITPIISGIQQIPY